jgi:hypothetical protein
MSTEAAMTAGAMPVSAEARKTFTVCFAALVATSFCFILRSGKDEFISPPEMDRRQGSFW